MKYLNTAQEDILTFYCLRIRRTVLKNLAVSLMLKQPYSLISSWLFVWFDGHARLLGLMWWWCNLPKQGVKCVTCWQWIHLSNQASSKNQRTRGPLGSPGLLSTACHSPRQPCHGNLDEKEPQNIHPVLGVLEMETARADCDAKL